MDREEMKRRTSAFAVEVVRFYRRLPAGEEFRVIGKQMLRSGTSVGANYRSACRARSRADYLAKLGIVEEEADETMFWLELLRDLGFDNPALTQLHDEADQLTAIIVKTRKALRENR